MPVHGTIDAMTLPTMQKWTVLLAPAAVQAQRQGEQPQR